MSVEVATRRHSSESALLPVGPMIKGRREGDWEGGKVD